MLVDELERQIALSKENACVDLPRERTIVVDDEQLLGACGCCAFVDVHVFCSCEIFETLTFEIENENDEAFVIEQQQI